MKLCQYVFFSFSDCKPFWNDLDFDLEDSEDVHFCMRSIYELLFEKS